MIHDPKTGRPDPKLARELFGLIETDQGFAFISDGIECLSKVELIRLARGSLKYTRRVAKILREFLREHEIAALSESASQPTMPEAKE